MNPPDYIQEFREKFVREGAYGPVIFAPPDSLESFITKLVEGRKAELAAKVEGIIAEHEHNPDYCNKDLSGCAEVRRTVSVYNDGVRDALTLIKQS